MADEQPLNGALSRNRCIVCGLANERGLRVSYLREGTGAVARYSFDDAWAGYPGLVHGGITGAVVDDLVVWSLVAASGKLSFTVDLRLRFRGPVRVGRPLVLSGRVLAERRAIADAEGFVRDAATGETLVEGRARLVRLPRERFAAVTGHDPSDPEWDPYF